MRRQCAGLILFLPLVLVLAAGCGTSSSTVIDNDQLAACQVQASDLTLPAQPVLTFPTTPGLSGQALTIDGSTALYPLFQAAAFDQANGTHTSVQQGGSLAGLHHVEAGTIQIGMSDVFFQDNATAAADTDLVDHRVATVAFTLAVNGDLRDHIHNLTTRPIQAIFDGTAINWQQLGGPNEYITVEERPASSGTRATLEHFLLGGSPAQPSNEHLLTKDSSDLVAQTIAATPGSIGYLATGYVINPSYQNSIFPVCIDGQPPRAASTPGPSASGITSMPTPRVPRRLWPRRFSRRSPVRKCRRASSRRRDSYALISSALRLR
jgi:ABC-type phosphate transport system substrate-binding protein